MPHLRYDVCQVVSLAKRIKSELTGALVGGERNLTIGIEKMIGLRIIQECLGYMACKLVGSIDAGDHRVYLGETLRAAFKDGRPYVHPRSDGLQY
jgi:hypothetical protein